MSCTEPIDQTSDQVTEIEEESKMSDLEKKHVQLQNIQRFNSKHENLLGNLELQVKKNIRILQGLGNEDESEEEDDERFGDIAKAIYNSRTLDFDFVGDEIAREMMGLDDGTKVKGDLTVQPDGGDFYIFSGSYSDLKTVVDSDGLPWIHIETFSLWGMTNHLYRVKVNSTKSRKKLQMAKIVFFCPTQQKFVVYYRGNVQLVRLEDKQLVYQLPWAIFKHPRPLEGEEKFD